MKVNAVEHEITIFCFSSTYLLIFSTAFSASPGIFVLFALISLVDTYNIN